MERRVNVRGIVVNDEGQLFAVKHAVKDGSESEYWATPGGGVDPGESLQDGLTREFIEELGIAPKIGKVLFMQQYVRVRTSGQRLDCLEVFMHVENHEDFNSEINLSTTTHGHELARVAFISAPEEDLLPEFLQRIDIKYHIDSDQPVVIVNNIQQPSR